ncbi:hypothetical protein SCA6_010007 [Theobroma cacao]
MRMPMPMCVEELAYIVYEELNCKAGGRTSERRILKSTQHLNFQHISGGYVVISTPDGILDHEEAISRNVGGQVFGYFH